MSVFLPGKFHGQKNLAGYSLWGHKDSDTTECIYLSIYITEYILFPILFHYRLFSSVHLLSRVRLFVTPCTAAHQASLFIINSWSLLKLKSIESVMPYNHLIPCHPLVLPLQPFPASGSFQMSQLFTSGGQSIGVSASTSVLPMNIQN